jgi:hypothetical protein
MTEDPKPSNIVPFGKYKGRLIEEVLADDPGYIEWLTGQDWFRTKFTVLHQVIINRGAEPEETPEHNAMQVRFLDDEFCLRFVRHLHPTYDVEAQRRFDLARKANLQLVIEKLEIEKEAPHKDDKALADRLRSDAEYVRSNHLKAEFVTERQTEAHERRERERDRHIKRMLQLERLRELLLPAITTVKFEIKRQFEAAGVDVVLKIMTGITWKLVPERDVTGAPSDPFWSWHQWKSFTDRSDWRAEFAIEIKPTIGDDYPAVLRQMKRTESDVLFVGAYTGRGATEEQFVATFAAANIRVVFARDVN